MTALRRRGPRPDAPRLQPAGAVAPSVDDATAGQSRFGPLLRLRAARAGVIGALLCGPAALAIAATASSPSPSQAMPAAPADSDAATAVAAAGWAETYVAAWLSSGRDDTAALSQMLAEPPPLTAVQAGQRWAAHTHTVAIDAADTDGAWTVTVAADVLVRTPTDPDIDEPGDYVAVGLQHYVVDVVTGTERGITARGLPAQVAAPATVELDAPAEMAGEVVDAVSQTAIGFVGALLTGSSPLDRWTAPDVTVAAIDPAPFATVDRAEVAVLEGDGDQVVAVVDVTASDTDARALAMTYRLELAPRADDDRWEVTAAPSAPAATARPPSAGPDGPARSGPDTPGP